MSLVEETTGVLDTNALILIERLRAEHLPAEPLITVISCRHGDRQRRPNASSG